MKIGITYNLKSDFSGLRPEHIFADDAFEEFDAGQTIEDIADIFKKDGHYVLKLGWGKQALSHLISEDIDFVFNISEGYCGRNRESQIPAVLEMLEIPYSGSDPLTLSLALDKIASKKLLKSAGIKTPNFSVINNNADIVKADACLKYPLFVKPAWEGSSKGIQQSSKVYDKSALARQAECLLKQYPGEPVLVEEYINGREFTVGVLGNKKPQIIGIMQIKSNEKDCPDFFYSKEIKRDWKTKVVYDCPPYIDVSLKKRLQLTALGAFKLFECRDISRIDLRVDSAGEVHFLEINPLPGLSKEYSDIVIMAKKMGWTYEKLIMSVFEHAISRYSIEKPNPTLTCGE